MDTTNLLIVFVSCPHEDAPRLADTIVIEKLAACVNIIAANSVYFWENELKHDDEMLLIIKTTANLFQKLETRIKEIHPYDIPEIVAIKADAVSAEYLKWVNAQTERNPS